jgi:hypothetical protein
MTVGGKWIETPTAGGKAEADRGYSYEVSAGLAGGKLSKAGMSVNPDPQNVRRQNWYLPAVPGTTGGVVW